MPEETSDTTDIDGDGRRIDVSGESEGELRGWNTRRQT